MSTVVVRKKDGSLMEFTHEKLLSFSVNRVDGFVTIWVHGGFSNVAQIEGVEAWDKDTLKLPVTDKFTGCYTKNGVFYEAGRTGYVVDGLAHFSIYPMQIVPAHDNKMRSHSDWLKLGFRPVEKVDLSR